MLSRCAVHETVAAASCTWRAQCSMRGVAAVVCLRVRPAAWRVSCVAVCVVSCGVWLGRARAGVAVSCMYVRSDCALRGLARRHTFQDLSIKIFTKYMDTSLMRHVCT